MDHHTKGWNKWRRGIIVNKKADFEYAAGPVRAHGYVIYDIKNCTTVTRTRHDIRLYKHSKVERELLETARKHLKAMIEQFHKKDSFRNEIGYPPKEFDIPENYNEQREEEIIQRRGIPTENDSTPDQTPQPPEQQTPEPTSDETQIKEEPRIMELPTEAPTRRPVSRELRNLESGLDGEAWQPCPTEHGRRMRVRAVDFKEEDEFTETPDNVRYLDPEEDTIINEPMEKRD